MIRSVASSLQKSQGQNGTEAEVPPPTLDSKRAFGSIVGMGRLQMSMVQNSPPCEPKAKRTGRRLQRHSSSAIPCAPAAARGANNMSKPV